MAIPIEVWIGFQIETHEAGGRMDIIITGGSGFLGQTLTQALIDSDLEFDRIVLADIVPPTREFDDRRVAFEPRDLSSDDAVDLLISKNTGIVFHLAAVVSSHAEAEFDTGWSANLDTTRRLLEKCRHTNRDIRFVFASSLAVYGGDLPEVVDDNTLFTPQSSYGAQKAVCELLVNDYGRKGLVDGRSLRLPTICIRPGKPNKAASSFVSGIIREPLKGEPSNCPAPSSLRLFVSSPNTVCENFIRIANLDSSGLSNWRSLNAPGISVTVAEMLDALERIAGTDKRQLVSFEPDSEIRRIVESWPARIDTETALAKGFAIDSDFDSIIERFIDDNG